MKEGLYPRSDTSLHWYKEEIRRAMISYRSLYLYASGFGFDEGEFARKFLRGNVADIGAGYLGLDVESRIAGLGCNIFSLSPTSTDPDFWNNQLETSLWGVDNFLIMKKWPDFSSNLKRVRLAEIQKQIKASN